MSCKRHLRPSDSKVAPRRLLLRFRLYSGPAARRPAGSALGVGDSFVIGEGADIGGGEFVLALPASFQIGAQFVSGKERTFLNADAMIAENCHIGGHRDLLCLTSLCAYVESIQA